MARTPPISVDAMSFGCRCKLKAEESYTVPFCTNDVTALNEPYSHTALIMGNRELIRSALLEFRVTSVFRIRHHCPFHHSAPQIHHLHHPPFESLSLFFLSCELTTKQLHNHHTTITVQRRTRHERKNPGLSEP